jgi:hypothetical protein
MRTVAFPLVLLALWAQASAVAPAIADEPAAQPSADLQVPTIEALRAPNARPSSGPDRVGDVVTFKMPGLQGEEFKFSASEGNPMDQGWQFAEEAKPDANVPSYAIVLMKGGRVHVPPVVVSGADGKPIAKTGAFDFDVVSAIAHDDPKPKEPQDPRPPVALRFPWLILAIAGLVALVLAGALTYALARWLGGAKAKPVPEKPALPPRPEDEVALEELANLAKQELPRQGKFKPHYFGISEILKTYIGGRYRFDAEESTSRELCQVLQREKGVGDGVLREVEELFAKLDFVKFTDHVPEVGEGAELLERAKKLVIVTRRPKIEVSATPGNGPALGGNA